MRTVDDAVLDLLRTALPPVTVNGALRDRVHDGHVPSDDTGKIVLSVLPYVVYYSDLGLDDLRRLSGRATRRETEFQITYVGITRDQAKWAGQRARAVLADQRLPVTGSRLVHVVESQRVLHDRDAVGPNQERLFYGVDIYAVAASIATA